MNVLLIDDPRAKLPNLALMKLSAWHKARGDQVGFNISDPDLIYVSCIFPKSRGLILSRLTFFPDAKKILGGYGFNNSKLPDEIEHICPDYSLYGINYSMGYTSRGCIRSCPWCVVPQKEGPIRDHAPLCEFLRHDKLILLDNNFLASPKWRNNMDRLIRGKIAVNFNQGLDIRLVDQETAHLLSRVRCMDHKFRRRALHFAFDLPSLESDVIQGVTLLERAGFRLSSLMCYVLVGFNTNFQEDLSRVRTLIRLGVRPYVMRYNFRRDDKRLNAFARWINGRYWKICDWERYRRTQLLANTRKEVRTVGLV